MDQRVSKNKWLNLATRSPTDTSVTSSCWAQRYMLRAVGSCATCIMVVPFTAKFTKSMSINNFWLMALGSEAIFDFSTKRIFRFQTGPDLRQKNIQEISYIPMPLCILYSFVHSIPQNYSVSTNLIGSCGPFMREIRFPLTRPLNSHLIFSPFVSCVTRPWGNRCPSHESSSRWTQVQLGL